MSLRSLKKNRSLLFYAALAIIIFLGLYLRLYAIIHTYVDTPIRADARDYYAYAYNLTNHGVYSLSTHSIKKGAQKPKPDANRSPGYPIFISIFANEFPSMSLLLNITLLQGILSLITLILTYKISIKISPKAPALLASFLTAISPHLINSNIYILTETLFTFFLVLTVYLTINFLKTPEKKQQLFLIGIIVGLGCLTRPSLQYFVFPLTAFLLFVNKTVSLQQKKNMILLILLGFTIIVAPWHVRNYISTGKFSDETLKINALHHGMYPNFTFQNQIRSYGFPYRFDPRSKEISESIASVSREIIHRFKTEPEKHLKWYFIDKPITFFSWDIIQGMGESFIYPIKYSPYFDKHLFIKSNAIMRSLHYPIVILAVIASILIWIPFFSASLPPMTTTIAQLLSLILFYFIFIHIILAPFPRYSVPLRPILYIMSVIPLLMLYNFKQQKKTNPRLTDS